MKNLLYLLAILFLLPACGTTGPSSSGGGTSGSGYSGANPCDRTPEDPTKIEWMDNLIKKYDIEQVIRYDHQENIVYFFKVLKCCDFQSFLYSCDNNRICTDGGFTGGDCHNLFKQLSGEQIIWQARGTSTDQ